MNHPTDFDILAKVFVKRFLAEEKMLYHTQRTVLARNKLLNSARKLHAAIMDYPLLSGEIKQHLLSAIQAEDVSRIQTVSAQVQEILRSIGKRNSLFR